MTKKRKQQQKHIQHQQGWGLLETLLTVGALSAMSLGIYMALGPTSATAKVKREQDNLRDLSSAVERSFGLLGSFSTVSGVRVVNDGLAPTRMLDDGMLVSAWGGSVDVDPFQVNRPDDAFVITYFDTPPEVCARLSAAVARSAFDIRVGGITGSSLYDANGLNPGTAAQECQAGNGTVSFVFYSGLAAGQAVAAAPLTLAPDATVGSGSSTVPASIVIPDAGDTGDASGVSPVVLPPGPGTPPAPPPAPAGGSTPGFTPTTPGGTGSTTPTSELECLAVAPGPQTDTRTVSCPVGQVGHLDEERMGSYSCPEAWEAPVWSGWSDWSMVASTCTPCPAPQTETLACPSGQLGEIVRERTYQCSGETGSWNGWSIVSNTCAAECVAPSPTSTPTSRAVAPQTQNVATCPAGQYGLREQTRTATEAGTTTTTYTCPAPTGSPTSSTSTSWSGTFTYGAWTYTGASTCTPCPGPQTDTRTQWVAVDPGCPAGETGTYRWEKEQRETRTGTYSCPAGTASLPAITWPAWTDAWVDTGATRNQVDTCAPASYGSCQEAFNAIIALGNVCYWDYGSCNFGNIPGPYTFQGPDAGGYAGACIATNLDWVTQLFYINQPAASQTIQWSKLATP